MSTNRNSNQPPIQPKGNKSATIVGAIIVLFGIFLLLKNLNLGFLFPSWLFGIPTIVLIIGIVIGVNSKFEKKSAWILIIIGGALLFKEWFHFSPFKIFIPIAAIALGIFLINRNRKNEHIPPPPTEPTPPRPSSEFDWDKRVSDFSSAHQTDPENATHNQFNQENTGGDSHSSRYQGHFNENQLKVDAIFGSAKKIILSKNFIGGTVTNVFGSTEINLLQADLQQPAVIDVFLLFGSAKIILPPHWTVSTNVSSILSENDDRRVVINHPFDESKKLFITGTAILGTLTIKNT